jgi:hypothetical protein
MPTFFAVLGMEANALCRLGKHSSTRLHPALGFLLASWLVGWLAFWCFETGSNHVAQIGLELAWNS